MSEDCAAICGVYGCDNAALESAQKPIGFADETTRPAQAAAAPQLITVALNCGLGTLQYR
eukprot:180124-Prorocentrum_minimum.AAC.4